MTTTTTTATMTLSATLNSVYVYVFAHGIWLVYEHMNRLFTPFCNVNYAFIAATMNPQCICSIRPNLFIVEHCRRPLIVTEPIYRLPNQTTKRSNCRCCYCCCCCSLSFLLVQRWALVDYEHGSRASYLQTCWKWRIFFYYNQYHFKI